jgi:hypothetical protein
MEIKINILRNYVFISIAGLRDFMISANTLF